MPDAIPPAAAPAPLEAAELTGQTLGDFYILRKIGQGGMGHVYLAEQLSLKRKVALKFLRPDLAANPTSLKRFRAEAMAMAKVSHPHIVQVYAVGEQDGRQFMALEYIEGRNLKDYLRLKGPLKLEVANVVMRQVALAIQRAGELGIVHRDIKPENILLNRQGPIQVKVADFGLSRVAHVESEGQPLNLTQSGVTMGTPLYMSPEQVQGQPVDHRSDIYSFGVTCFQMLTGEPPYRGMSAFEVALQHVQGTPPEIADLRSDLPPELCALIKRMMAKDPAERPQTGREVVQALAALRSGKLDGPASGSFVPYVSEGGTTVAPAPAAWPAWVRYGALGLTVVAAAGAGAAVRRLTQPIKPPTATSPAVVAEPTPAAPPIDREEQALRLQLEVYSTPAGDHIVKGVNLHIELGVYYLDHGRYDDAESFFEALASTSKVPQYQTLGLIGQGIALAFKDRADASLTKFQAAFGDKEKRLAFFAPKFSGREMAELRHWIVRALERDEVTKKVLPDGLKEMLKGLKSPRTGAAGGKAT